MKKFISILAIALVSLNFVSCRQDDVTSDLDVNPTSQEKLTFNKGGVTADTVAAKAQRPVDPDPPVKDGTSW
ncbi:MAG: hypothetical protein BGO86_03315 [Chryseobacterium sp. 36-9]|uniref:Lipoprotein n=1 Tax=Epilithonimonas pallida TaxID=373671 RepID=A0ABY1QZG9_9FLAO|nr:hypothetical protein [Epilithonimonas pallida]OJX31363.1 MAG: hypothetical protein BGO86_03315 [Chryseobacterium sp. 36-9]SMP86229.1 hypothetical protein SAMN05421679_10197 [Epilithonimonas pallida]